MKRTATIVKPINKRKKTRRGYLCEVVNNPIIHEIEIEIISENEIKIQVKDGVDRFEYKETCELLALGCFMKESNFFSEVRKVLSEEEGDINCDDTTGMFKLYFEINSKKRYEFYRTSDDSAQENLIYRLN